MADTKITALTAITTVDPAVDVLPIVDVSDTTMAASGTTKKITSNQILGAGCTATLASATITGDLTVATDRLKVVTGSTAIQTGSTTQLQVGTTSWPSTVIGKSGSRSLFGNTGEVVLWTEAAPAIGNYSTLFVTAKTGAGATTMGGLQIRAGIENASNSDGFVSLWTSNSAAGGFVERYKIDSTGVATWSNVGGVAGTAMTLNSTGLGVGTSPSYKVHSVVTSGYAGAFKSSTAVAGGILAGNSVADLIVGVDASGNGRVTADTSKYLGLGSGGINDRFILDTSGNVGVGVTPINKLQVAASALAAVPAAGASGHIFAIGSTPYGIAAGALTSGNSYIQATRWDGTATNYDLLLQPNGGNLGFNGLSFGGGSKVIFIGNGTAPSSNPTAGGILYVEAGALKYRGSSGTVTTLANA